MIFSHHFLVHMQSYSSRASAQSPWLVGGHLSFYGLDYYNLISNGNVTARLHIKNSTLVRWQEKFYYFVIMVAPTLPNSLSIVYL